ncbi:MAG: ATP-binding protein [Polyangiaceae bacterium]
MVEQMLVNLVMNAAEASSRPQRIDLVAVPDRERGSIVRVRVTDAGPGVPEELRDRVFEPFFTTKPKGTGIGLTTAREAARDLGGDLVLEDSDRGACFAVLLPMASRGNALAREGT